MSASIPLSGSIRPAPASFQPLGNGDTIHKNELIQLHQLLNRVRMKYPPVGATVDAFEEYEKAMCYPTHVHKSKQLHQAAVFMLAEGLSRVTEQDDLARRFEAIRKHH